MKKLFGRTDLIIIICVLILSLLLFVPNLLNNDTLTAQIYIDGEIAEEIDLGNVSDSYTLTPADGVEITVEKNKIRFSYAECKDKLCVKSGWLSKKGQTAACLPKKVVIAIKGTDKTDMMTY